MLATTHPKWMASLGMHEDWHQRFPDSPAPSRGEVAKAFPWVPIGYQQAFNAHRERIARLLAKSASPFRISFTVCAGIRLFGILLAVRYLPRGPNPRHHNS